MAFAGDMRLVSASEAEIFDGSAWVPAPGASVSEMEIGADGVGNSVVVVRVGPGMTPMPTGNLDMGGFFMGMAGSVSITDGLSQSGTREFVGTGSDDGRPEFTDGGVTEPVARDAADPMARNDDNGSSA